MRRTIVLCLILMVCTVFSVAQTSPAPANQGSAPTTSNPNSPASPDLSNPQNTIPPDKNQTGSAPSATTPSNASASGNQSAAGREIAAGTEIRATLDTPLSTKTSKEGDTFTATVTEPVRSSDGQVAVPAGSKIQGEVTESEQGKTLAALRGKGKLNMHFRDIQLPDGSTLPLSATLISVNSTKGAKSSTNSEGEVQSGNTGTHTAKDVGIGAGIGTIAGLIFGGALKGLAIGAAAGGGYVLATNGKQVELPAQTGLRLRVDHNLSMSSSTGGQ